MPYVIHSSNVDSRATSFDFDPKIAMDIKRQLSGALPLTPEGMAAIPNRLRVGKPRRGPIPHILGSSMGPWIVSEEVRDLLEGLEPGIQDFRPVELISGKDQSYLKTYYLILLPPIIDAIVKEKTEFVSPSLLRPRGVCVLDEEAIRGRHLWRAERPLQLTYFCSDELGDRLKAHKLHGWDLRHRCTTTHSVRTTP